MRATHTHTHTPKPCQIWCTRAQHVVEQVLERSRNEQDRSSHGIGRKKAEQGSSSVEGPPRARRVTAQDLPTPSRFGALGRRRCIVADVRDRRACRSAIAAQAICGCRTSAAVAASKDRSALLLAPFSPPKKNVSCAWLQTVIRFMRLLYRVGGWRTSKRQVRRYWSWCGMARRG